MEQNRFKSWALWVGVAGAVWTILAAFGLPEKVGITSDIWNTVLNSVGAILVAFGICNDPTSADKF